jgi:hypothetical protein
MRECHEAPAAIATHAALPAIRIIVHHPEIVTIGMAQQHEAISAYTKAAMAQGCYLLCGQLYFISPVVYQDEVVAGAVVFIEGHDVCNVFTDFKLIVLVFPKNIPPFQGLCCCFSITRGYTPG